MSGSAYVTKVIDPSDYYQDKEVSDILKSNMPLDNKINQIYEIIKDKVINIPNEENINIKEVDWNYNFDKDVISDFVENYEEDKKSE